jgi:SAM-dependent methyltransferase
MLTSVPDIDQRFAFGKNWAAFLGGLNDQRIAEAEKSVQALLGMESLSGKTFLDVGSGSALFSLVARRLGASVHSFDFDEDAVNCARTLRKRYFPNDENWIIQQGSVLDSTFVHALGTFDIVYSWGVLHHTGAMYQAIENAASRVKPGGVFSIALYRKTLLCEFWKMEKKWYAGASARGQAIARSVFERIIRLAFWKNGKNFKEHVDNYHSVRGMDYERDLHDWLGGYPYESIAPQEVAILMQSLGLVHVRSNVYSKYPHGLLGSGCDEFVYRRPGPAPAC